MYGFKINLYTTVDDYFSDFDENGNYSFMCNLNGESVEIKIETKESKNKTLYVVKSQPYLSEESAMWNAIAIKDSLLYSSVKLNRGLSFKTNESKGVFSKAFLDKLSKENNYYLMNDANDIQIFPTDKKVMSMSLDMNPKFGKPISALSNHIKEFTDLNYKLSKREQLSIEFFNLSYFNTNPIIKFLLLVISLECLCECPDRDEKTMKYLDSIKDDILKSSLPQEDRTSISGSFKYLKQLSILQTLKLLASIHAEKKDRLNMTTNKFIGVCYDIRSKLVHDGVLPESEYTIHQYVNELRSLAQEILVNILKR